MAEAYYSTSSYAYVLNNPIGLIDPNGMFAAPPTDFYNLKGKKVYSDGVKNGEKKLVLTLSKKKKTVKKAIDDGLAIRVHSEGELEAMNTAYSDTETDNNHEEGFVGGILPNGGIKISPMDPGLQNENQANIDPTSAEIDHVNAGANIEYEAHTHPYKTEGEGYHMKIIRGGIAGPSVRTNEDGTKGADVGYMQDLNKKHGTSYGIVLGYSENGSKKQINFYNTKGSIITVGFEFYKATIRKINSK